ncbi:hypothetical protein BJ322DRAFT_1219680 [Thelephora terrestris]|uniref:Uncharacterized protein n=1 Tax=Thelephora terrestris TaxID=56493 RepID=A0A9P6HB09_9AGAM|nr:hypothetical protein BJ322DRAFT_1219680 [Thelephora terrestris]
MAPQLDKPHTTRSHRRMDDSASMPAPFIFDPHSVYILFVERQGETFGGVFHHHKDQMGRLAWGEAGVALLPESQRMVFVRELDLKHKIESKFNIVTAHKVAHLHYHDFWRHDHFINHGQTVISDENEWMVDVLSRLKQRSGHHWKHSTEPEHEKFRELVERHTPKGMRVVVASAPRSERLPQSMLGVEASERDSCREADGRSDSWLKSGKSVRAIHYVSLFPPVQQAVSGSSKTRCEKRFFDVCSEYPERPLQSYSDPVRPLGYWNPGHRTRRTRDPVVGPAHKAKKTNKRNVRKMLSEFRSKCPAPGQPCASTGVHGPVSSPMVLDPPTL